MWAAWFLFGLLWFMFAWMSLDTIRPAESLDIQIHTPIFKQNCTSKSVSCIDDCNFLCVESNGVCVGGTCVVETSPSLDCNAEKGGVVMLNTTPQWICLCTDPSIWSGPTCDTLNPDVCEHGMFVYEGLSQFQCVCPFPYKKITLEGKVHCLEKHLMWFFDKASMINEEPKGARPPLPRKTLPHIFPELVTPQLTRITLGRITNPP